MRIVDFVTFIQSPVPTLYCECVPEFVETIQVFLGRCPWEDSIDYFSRDLIHIESWTAAEHLDGSPLDMECYGRDGIFDTDRKYAVFEADDLRGLQVFLGECLAAAEGTKP